VEKIYRDVWFFHGALQLLHTTYQYSAKKNTIGSKNYKLWQYTYPSHLASTAGDFTSQHRTPDSYCSSYHCHNCHQCIHCSNLHDTHTKRELESQQWTL